MNILGQRILQCEHCKKDFLYFGIPQEDEQYFCSPECSEAYKNRK